MDQGYSLVYDVTREIPPVWFPGVGLLLTIVGVFVFVSLELCDSETRGG